MIVSIHQPDYIPYPGLFYKMSQSEIFVFLDDAQFSSDNVHHWNKIKTPQGEFKLKIPVDYKFGQKINKVRTKDELGWKEKHLKTIEMNYKKAPYFEDFFPKFKEVLMKEYSSLAEQNIAITTMIAGLLKINVKFIKSSDMGIYTAREERVIDICKALDGTEYISGHGAKAYQVEENFTNRDLKLTYTDYKPVEYPQQWEKQSNRLINMSIIDYIFNCGYDFENIIKMVKGNE